MKVKITSDQIHLNSHDVILFFEADVIPNIGDRISILSFIDNNEIRRNFQNYLKSHNFNPDAKIIEKVWQRDVFNSNEIYLLIYLEFSKPF